MLTGTCSGCQGGADAPGVERRVFKRLKVWRVLRGGLVVLRHSPSTLYALNATLIIIEIFKKLRKEHTPFSSFAIAFVAWGASAGALGMCWTALMYLVRTT